MIDFFMLNKIIMSKNINLPLITQIYMMKEKINSLIIERGKNYFERCSL